MSDRLRPPLLTGMRAVAVLEALKGLAALLAGASLLGLLHRDVPAIAAHLIRLSHLDPASRYPRLLAHAAEMVTDQRVRLLSGIALAYALVRGVEAYGLWHERRWAEWFALASGALYVPLEIYELIHHATGLKAGVLAVNVGIVAYLAFALRRSAAPPRGQRETRR